MIFNNTSTLSATWLFDKPFDYEYLIYKLLGAYTKWKKSIDNDDFTSVFEILFHSINLGKLKTNGNMLDFNYKNLEGPKLTHMQEQFAIEDTDENLIFYNTRYLLINIINEHIKYMLNFNKDLDIKYPVDFDKKLKEIYFTVVNENSKQYYRMILDDKHHLGYNIASCDYYEVLRNRNIEVLSKDKEIDLDQVAIFISILVIINIEFISGHEFYTDPLDKISDTLKLNRL